MNKDYIQLPLDDLKKYKLGTSYYVRINFPYHVAYDNKQYIETGVVGIRLSNRVPAAQYECNGDIVWCDANMEVYKD